MRQNFDENLNPQKHIRVETVYIEVIFCTGGKGLNA